MAYNPLVSRGANDLWPSAQLGRPPAPRRRANPFSAHDGRRTVACADGFRTNGRLAILARIFPKNSLFFLVFF
jgi:hypothetical protein